MKSLQFLPMVVLFGYTTSFNLSAQSRDHLINVQHNNLLSTPNPIESSLGYDNNSIYYYDGLQWQNISDSWKTNGNTIDTSAYIGCNNSESFRIRTNNVDRLNVDANGNVGLGISPQGRFQVRAATPFDLFVSNTISGTVGIGTQYPTEALHVVGNVLANAFNTPDYVFEQYFEGKNSANSNYQWHTLEEVEHFSKTHKHLPNMPSAKEVEQQGGNLLNKATERNLEKIEELFLHLYELKKKTTQLDQRMKQL